MTGIRTHTLPIRNTRAWIRCSLLLGCDKSLSSISFHLTASFIPQSQFAIGLRESSIQSSRYFWPRTQRTSCGWQVFFFNWEGGCIYHLGDDIQCDLHKLIQHGNLGEPICFRMQSLYHQVSAVIKLSHRLLQIPTREVKTRNKPTRETDPDIADERSSALVNLYWSAETRWVRVLGPIS